MRCETATTDAYCRYAAGLAPSAYRKHSIQTFIPLSLAHSFFGSVHEQQTVRRFFGRFGNETGLGIRKHPFLPSVWGRWSNAQSVPGHQRGTRRVSCGTAIGATCELNSQQDCHQIADCLHWRPGESFWIKAHQGWRLMVNGWLTSRQSGRPTRRRSKNSRCLAPSSHS